MRKKSREEIQAEMAAFLAKGGEVTQIARGVSSQVYEVIYDTKYGNYRYKNQKLARKSQGMTGEKITERRER